ncbi:hypothetical protein NQ317_001263 [Molorchus minor]|uniref:Uncharacterized protein n=1 Tax=Molorchus minor TaxID=1323400 RepID=A0ABQ9IW87_9CUCU|nr:hypothetical protein NQ317_001263 [Molorchus minor]
MVAKACNGNESSVKSFKPNSLGPLDTSHGMEIAQLLLSLLHSWGLDNDLDPSSCFIWCSIESQPHVVVPTYVAQHDTVDDEQLPADLSLTNSLPPELVRQEQITRIFTSQTHWELSTTLTTNHLLAIIALSHTLMSMSNATFVPEQERNRKLHRQSTRVNWSKTDEEHEEMFTQQQAQIQARLVFISDTTLSSNAGSKNFKRPQVEMMAKRWQHHCVEG